MTAIRSRAIEFIHEIPEEKLTSLLDYMQFLCEKRHPLEITSKEQLYRHLDEGMDDIKNGRFLPFDEAMREIRQELKQKDID